MSHPQAEPLVSPAPPYARTGAGVAVLAVLVPALLVAGALAWLGRPEAETAAVHPDLAACRAKMEKRPDVVLIGNSKASTDVDEAALAPALAGKPRVAVVSINATGGQVWYAALRQCVLQADSPKLVVVYGTAGAAAQVEVRGPTERDALEAFQGAALPAIQEKVLGADARGPFWDRVDRRTSAIQTAIQHTVRDAVAGLFFAPPGPDGLLAAGRAHAEPALARVLGADAGVDAERARAIPIADAGEARREERGPALADTLVPDIVAAAKEAGARLVFVRAPVADWKGSYDPVAPELVQELVGHLNAEGAGYLDLTTGSWPRTAFGDGVHMNAAGRAKLTRALAEGLDGLDALSAGPFAAAAVPRAPPAVSRTGTPPALPALALERGPNACDWQAKVPALAALSDPSLARAGFGPVSPILVLEDGRPLAAHARKQEFADTCAGAASHQGPVVKLSPSDGPPQVAASRAYTLVADHAVPHVAAAGEAFWVYPGTALRLDVAEPWAAADPFTVGVVGYAALPGARPAEVTVTGAPPAPLSPDGADVVAVLAPPTPAGPWSIEIRSPADGPWLLVQRVVVGDAERPWFALGKADAARSLALHKGEAAYAAATLPTVPVVDPVQGADKAWIADVSALRAPWPGEAYRLVGVSRCGLLQLLEDGAPLPAPGKYTHHKRGVGFTTPDGSSPIENGRAYTVVLDPERKCGLEGRWLYPGDALRLTLPPAPLDKVVREAASVLDLTAAAIPLPGDAVPDLPLHVRLIADDAVVLDEQVSLATLAERPPRWTLATPVARAAKELVLELSTPPGAPYVIVSSAYLVEPGRPAFPAGPGPSPASLTEAHP